jgi:uncharacterized protein YcbK (DUF882 family)
MSYLSKNFTKKELECPCCGRCDIDEEFLEELQYLRNVVERPFVINSGFRCPAHNEKVGGSVNSNHKLGKAVDISIDGWSGQEIYDFLHCATDMSMTGIGIYPSWIHFDTRESHAAWVSL